MDPLVSVIIPTYNAQVTLDETLISVRAQNYRNLDIIIVDDGSTDGSALIAKRHEAADSRIRLIRQPNSGVAAARNAAIAVALGSLIAPIDADDLWAQTKISSQVAAMAQDESVGLVYCWFCVIDECSNIISYEKENASGNVFEWMLLRNLLGNGSSPLIRRSVLEECGCYDSSLRLRGAEGCEDYLLYLRIAEHYQFSVVSDYLVGYRETPSNMSSDVLRMLRSRSICMATYRLRYPEFAFLMNQGRAHFIRHLLVRAVRARAVRSAFVLLHEQWQLDRLHALRMIKDLGWRRTRNTVARLMRRVPPTKSVPFCIGTLS